MKRSFDILVSSFLIFMLSPLLLLLALLVRLKLGGPVLFRQRRPGLNCRPFMMYKFRTMTNACDQKGSLLADQQRLTPFGKLLRSTSLDELPELVNVLKGEMSLVGPRPLLEEYVPLYTTQQIRRHLVRPGITGWAQVNGRNAIDWDDRFKLDIWYIDNRSFMLDLKILWLTVIKVFVREGINQEGHVTMDKFRGSN